MGKQIPYAMFYMFYISIVLLNVVSINSKGKSTYICIVFSCVNISCHPIFMFMLSIFFYKLTLNNFKLEYFEDTVK